MDIVDKTYELVTTWSQPVPIENVNALRLYLQQPLAMNEKIPISQECFNALCVSYSEESPWSSLTAQQLSTLFRVSTDDRAPAIKAVFLNTIRRVPPSFGTERRFHSTYDNNITAIIEFILPKACITRTSTDFEWPDFSLAINNYCLLRGEEGGSLPTGNPEKALINKIARWEYNPLPCILGLL